MRYAVGFWVTAVMGGLGLSAGFPATSCTDEAKRRDVHSFSRPDEIRVTHIALDLKVDFDRKALRGHATLTVARQPGCPDDAPMVLDTRDLTIESVSLPGGGKVPFELGEPDPVLGTPLRIDLPASEDTVKVAYRTSADASALQWVEPSGTAGGTHPFLYSQSQAIHARSWIPCQDSPGVRVTYEATVRTPQGLTAVMSADSGGEPVPGTVETERPSEVLFRFTMPQPIPTYLIALAVGELRFRALGPRTGVYAEPALIEEAAFEFADTERMLAVAEARFGPYRWGRYDLMVLPPSFPFGGMENAKLTFATPTILAGDRSLVALVAHELAHSWSGNLVTNATWRDFWLNEGFTTYLQGRIIEDLYGPEQAAMEDVLGYQELLGSLERLEPQDQILHIDLTGRDPDDGFSLVPYEKGKLFLVALEHAFGRERFDAFLRNYFDHFAFQSITTNEFEAYLHAHLLENDTEAAATLDVSAWLSEPGLPENAPVPSSDRFETVDRLALAWLEGRTPVEDLPAEAWSTHEWLRFLRALPEDLPNERLAALDDAFRLTDQGNAEIIHQWLLLAVRSGYSPADERLESFLTTVGRRKFLMPLFEELVKTAEGRARARAIYHKARARYHPIAVESVDRLLGHPPSPGAADEAAEHGP